MLRVNLGCGPHAAPGWLNCDIRALRGVELRTDLRAGLPFRAESVDCIVAIHLLQDLAWHEIAPALAELHRVLKHGGVLRVAVPDLDKAIEAYRARSVAYFYVPDRDARSVGGEAHYADRLVRLGAYPFHVRLSRRMAARRGLRQYRALRIRRVAASGARRARQPRARDAFRRNGKAQCSASFRRILTMRCSAAASSSLRVPARW